MRFICKQCGACCKPGWAGDYQLVFFNETDRKNICEFLEMTNDELCEKYEIANQAMNTSHAACRFLDDNDLCTIHSVKPDGCAKWPWIRGNKEFRGQRPNAKRCPGIIIEDTEEWNR